MSVMYIRNEQTGEFEPVPSLVGPQGPPGANGGGAGTVTSVNKVVPDATGNVTLTAANVGARPNTWTPTAADVGALPSGGTAANAASLNGKSADKYMLKTDTAADSDKLGGVAASEYAKMTDIPESGGVDLLTVYPVGSIYMSVNATSPASLFGGTWENIYDAHGNRFLLAAGGTWPVGYWGGESTHTLTIEEMPSHRHSVQRPRYFFDEPIISETLTAIGEPELTTPVVTGYVDYVGGDQPHNNMPPFLTVFMWKRVS